MLLLLGVVGVAFAAPAQAGPRGRAPARVPTLTFKEARPAIYRASLTADDAAPPNATVTLEACRRTARTRIMCLVRWDWPPRENDQTYVTAYRGKRAAVAVEWASDADLDYARESDVTPS